MSGKIYRLQPFLLEAAPKGAKLPCAAKTNGIRYAILMTYKEKYAGHLQGTFKQIAPP